MVRQRTTGFRQGLGHWGRFVVAVFAASLSAAAAARDSVSWPNDAMARLNLIAQWQSLRVDLLANASATEVLRQWCEQHHLAEPARIVADRMAVPSRAPDMEQLRRLDVAAAEEVRYRRVELRCGDHVLSKAENWYVPARLTPEMNRLLETTDTPFGQVVSPLKPFRKTVETTPLWLPPAIEGDCPARGGRLILPAELLRHRVVLYSADLVPFSEVVEVYQDDLMDFAPRVCAVAR